MSDAVVEVDGLTLSYDDEPVVEDVTCSFPVGSLIGVIGPNGAGKSTLIKAIVGAKKADRGSILIQGKPAAQGRKSLTYVPQRGAVDWDFPITAQQVVRQGRFESTGLLGRFGNEDRDAVRQAMESVDITDLSERQIGELSGGQRQRVFLARALAQGGSIFVMDEPFAGVDVSTESAIVEVLRDLRDQGKTVIVVHHDLVTVRDYFDHLLMLNRNLVAFGPTEDVFSQDNLRRTYGGRVAVISDSNDGK